jgi:type 1 glutamine amidotransferase
MRKTFGWILLLAGLAALACPAVAADKVSVLIIDGQNGHDWKATTPVIKQLLEKTDRFTVDVLTSPPAKSPKDAWEKFKPDFSKHKAVVINYYGEAWPEDVQKSFVKYVEDGGGVVVYHFTVAAFREWPEFNRMIGLGWKDNKFGDRIAFDESMKQVRQPKGEGIGCGHGAAHEFQITVIDKNDPITKGMPEKFDHVKDELYAGQRGPAENMHFLAVAWSAKEEPKRGTGMFEPMAWTIPFGKGRCFTTLLGHDGPATSDPASAALLTRGTEWAATGEVTIPLPKDLVAAPAAEKKE